MIAELVTRARRRIGLAFMRAGFVIAGVGDPFAPEMPGEDPPLPDYDAEPEASSAHPDVTLSPKAEEMIVEREPTRAESVDPKPLSGSLRSRMRSR